MQQMLPFLSESTIAGSTDLLGIFDLLHLQQMTNITTINNTRPNTVPAINPLITNES